MINNIESKIVFAAISEFREHGFEGATVSGICKVCHITKKTFYYHYPSKESVLIAYYQQLPPSIEDICVKMLRHKKIDERLWFLYETLIKKAKLLGPDLMKVVLKYCIDTPDFFSTLYSDPKSEKQRTLDQVMIEVIKEGQQTGVFRAEPEALLLHRSFSSSIMGACIGWCASLGKTSDIAGLRTTFDTIFLK